MRAEGRICVRYEMLRNAGALAGLRGALAILNRGYAGEFPGVSAGRAYNVGKWQATLRPSPKDCASGRSVRQRS